MLASRTASDWGRLIFRVFPHRVQVPTAPSFPPATIQSGDFFLMVESSFLSTFDTKTCMLFNLFLRRASAFALACTRLLINISISGSVVRKSKGHSVAVSGNTMPNLLDQTCHYAFRRANNYGGS